MSIDDKDNTFRQTDQTQHLQQQVRNDAGEVVDKAKHEFDHVAQRAKEDARELKHEAEAKIGEATDKAKSFANDQKSLAAGQITGIADAINKVAGELDSSDQQTVARYARDLASGLSSFGKTVDERNVDDLMGMAQDFGRKQPLAFLGAAALAGFVASRFALASAHRRETAASSSVSSTGQSRSDTYSSRNDSYGSESRSGASYASPNTGSASSSTYGSSSYGNSSFGQNRAGDL